MYVGKNVEIVMLKCDVGTRNVEIVPDTLFLTFVSDGHARVSEGMARMDPNAGAHQPLRPRGQQLHQYPHICVQG